MTSATGIGSWPGSDARAFAEALHTIAGELPDLAHVPELPGRGATASMTGRGLAVMADLGADLQPAGWRLTDSSGVDHRRAISLLAQDLDGVEETFQGYSGTFKLQIAGPWTLAATVERPRGDRVLGDHGARRELAQALAEGLRTHIGDVRRRLGGADRMIVQVDEPALAAVMKGQVPTASGLHKHRTIDRPEASQALEWVLDAIAESGAEPWVHSCAPDTDLALVRGAGVRGLAVDLGVLSAGDIDVLGEAFEAGDTVALGLDVGAASAGQVAQRVHRWLGMLGLDVAEVSDHLVLTPPCGLASANAATARRTLTTLVQAADELS